MTLDELRSLPPTIDVPTASRILGINPSLGYALVKRNEFPVPVIKVGRFLRIPTAQLARSLGIDLNNDEGPLLARQRPNDTPEPQRATSDHDSG